MLGDESYRALQQALVENPARGAVIRGTSGIRKIRWAARGVGKRGGARVIYYWHRPGHTLLMLVAYAKNVQVDLTAEQRKRLRRLVEEQLP